jgi:DNA replication protein
VSLTDRCPICDGYEWRERLIPWRDRHVERCVCWRARKKAERLAGAGIPAKYTHASFETFQAYNASLVEARRITQFWAESYPTLPRRADDRAGRGLVLSGPAGIGKTHLAAVLLRHVITATSCRGLFYTTKELLYRIRQSYNATIQATESEILQPIMTCDVLVLDDLGEERVTEWVAETMSLIVNARYNANRPIICTTNYADVSDPDEINGLLWRVGFRIQSRLHEMCEFVELEGASYRDLPPNGTEADLRRLARASRKATPARAQLRRPPGAHDGKADLKWSGGKGGNT